MDTFDLPWLDEAEDHSQEFRLGQEIDLSSSGRDLLEYKAKPDTRLDDPGVILFVNPDRTRLLLVFLIAETPTGGVSKNALHDALDQIAWLRGLEPRRKQAPSRDAVFVGGENNGGLGTIRILGLLTSQSYR